VRLRYVLPLILTAQSAPPPAPADDAEIVVTARKLSTRWKGSVSTVDGQTGCKTVHSTGDSEFDTIGCTAMLQCWADYSSKVDAAYRAERDAGRIKTTADFQKSKPIRAVYRQVGKCIRPKIFSGVRAVLKQRRA
jgi:hypothetical protein